MGRRTSKTINGTQTRFHYDGLTPVQELDGSGTVVATLLTGLGIDEYLTRTDAGGTRHLVTDVLGSTVAELDGSATAQATFTYEPFGATAVTGTSGNTFRYTGREDDGAGLYYYRARYYDVTRQRFPAEDPLGFTTGEWNVYAYVGNDPLLYADPMGLERCCSTPYFVCFAKCVEENRWDWAWLTAFNLGNVAGNIVGGGTGRVGVGGTPPHATSWQHKVGGRLGGPLGSRIGRIVVRAAILPLIFEGSYDIGTIGRCSVVCAGTLSTTRDARIRLDRDDRFCHHLFGECRKGRTP